MIHVTSTLSIYISSLYKAIVCKVTYTGYKNTVLKNRIPHKQLYKAIVCKFTYTCYILMLIGCKNTVLYLYLEKYFFIYVMLFSLASCIVFTQNYYRCPLLSNFCSSLIGYNDYFN